MKTNQLLPTTLLTALLLISCTPFLKAQDAAAKPQLLYIHEDPVYPDKVGEYEKVSKDLIDQYKKYNIVDNWLTIQGEDHKYYTVVPIENMASLDHDPMAPLQEKMGKEAFAAIFTAFDKCYPSHRDYLVMRLTKESYMPNGEALFSMEKPYRKYHYFYYTPQNRTAVSAFIKKAREYYVSKGATFHYNIYVSRFGNNESYFMVEEAAKDAKDFKQLSDANDKLLGEEWKAKMEELKKITVRNEQKAAFVRPELSYSVLK
jgi:hypothetical protein